MAKWHRGTYVLVHDNFMLIVFRMKINILGDPGESSRASCRCNICAVCSPGTWERQPGCRLEGETGGQSQGEWGQASSQHYPSDPWKEDGIASSVALL